MAARDRDFPNWSLWRSRRDDGSLGAWWATRDRLLTETEMNAGLVHTLAADDEEELHELLRAQDRREHGSMLAGASDGL